MQHAIWQELKPYVLQISEAAFENRQKLTHQLIRSKFHLITLRSKPSFLMRGIWIAKDSLKNYPFPKTILSFFSRKKYF